MAWGGVGFPMTVWGSGSLIKGVASSSRTYINILGFSVLSNMLGAPFSVLGLYRLADHLAIAELRAGSDEDRDAWVIAQERINGLEQRLGRSEQRVAACVREGLRGRKWRLLLYSSRTGSAMVSPIERLSEVYC